jgi:hypothetical protein
MKDHPVAANDVRAFRSANYPGKIMVEIETNAGPTLFLLKPEHARSLADALTQTASGLHPMYRLPEDESVLCQGDLISSKLLVASKALDGHQDYIKSRGDFRLFCVMTQTCDLQPNHCKEYITLSVVRAMRNVFDKESIRNSKGWARTSAVIERIIEHQQNSRDYFYLHPQPEYEIDEDSVVDLRVMFSLHSDLHYKQILKSRRLSMNEIYAANLGWMAGNVFARIAMPAWEKWHPKETKEARVEALMQMIQEKGAANRSNFEVPNKSLTPNNG